MYAKLIFRNAKRSAKDYLIYIVTMTVCVMMFYSLLSISSVYYKPDIGTTYDITMLSDGMKLAICFITLILLFLIRYVNNYMLKFKQKEFAIQSIMGMEQKTVSWLFFAETFIMGIISIVLGILLGAFGSQLITAMLLTSYGKHYQLTWTLFPDTVLLTILFFVASLLVVGLLNIHTIQKIKIIDMLSYDRLNECGLKKSRFMPFMTLLYGLVSIFSLYKGVEISYHYFDNRYPFFVHVLFGGNIILPILSLLCFVIWLFGKKRNFSKLVIVQTTFSIFNMFITACVPLMRSNYNLAYGSDIMSQYIILTLIHAVYLICGFMFLLNSSILVWKAQSPEHRYNNENLFLLGQITSKLSTNTKTMSLISITLVFSICLFMITPVLTNWIKGYLEIRSVFDIQIATSYNLVYDEKDLPDSNYDIVTDFIKENNIKPLYDKTFSLYLPKRQDFTKRKISEFPAQAISLSDYNDIRKMLGYKAIKLQKGEFATQWYALATEDERQQFVHTHSKISTDGGELVLAENSCYLEQMGNSIYNLYTNVLLIFPDEICNQLLAVNRERFIITKDPVSFSDAKKLERIFYNAYPEEQNKEGVEYSYNAKTIQTNSSLTSSFILKASMNYGAVILMVISLTILSLQQLLDAGKYKYRFAVLRKLGVEGKNIKMLVFKQILVWFGLPVLVSIILSVVTITCFMQSVSAEIVAYIGIETLISQVSITVTILALLLICYFTSTWILFKKAIRF